MVDGGTMETPNFRTARLSSSHNMLLSPRKSCIVGRRKSVGCCWFSEKMTRIVSFCMRKNSDIKNYTQWRKQHWKLLTLIWDYSIWKCNICTYCVHLTTIIFEEENIVWKNWKIEKNWKKLKKNWKIEKIEKTKKLKSWKIEKSSHRNRVVHGITGFQLSADTDWCMALISRRR